MIERWKGESRVKWISRSRKSASRHPNVRPKDNFCEASTMADYKTYLASCILTEDKVVCFYLEMDSLKF
jgi:hypothetical protein